MPGYSEPTNLFLVAALPPGNRKSAVQKAACNPLIDWEREQRASMEGEIANARSALKTQQARVDSLRRKAANAKTSDVANQLAAEVTELESKLPVVPVPPRLWTSDATPEKVGMLLSECDERIAWLSSEGGIFDTLAGRYSGGIPNLDIILKAHSGDSERIDRATREPIQLDNPLLTIGLSPQPSVLSGLASERGFSGRGLLARFLYFLPPSTVGQRTLESHPIPAAVTNAYAAGLQALLNVEPMVVGDQAQEAPHVLQLSAAALAEWRDYQRHIENLMAVDGELEPHKDWGGKAPGAAARVAGVLHCIKHAHGHPARCEIDADTMNAALAFMVTCQAHTLSALSLMGSDPKTNGARRVLDWIQSGCRERFTARDAFRAHRSRYPSMAHFAPVLTILEERGYIIEEAPEQPPGPGRRPSPTYQVNPSVQAS